MTVLAWGAKVSPAFRSKVAAIAEKGGFDPSWLMACMAFETGRTFSPSVRNPQSSATGLIQFMEATARGLGTTTAALAAKTAEAQLDDVARYFSPFAGRIKSMADCYMAILWPEAVGKPESFVLFGDGSKAYLANKGLDADKDGRITKAEAAMPAARLLAEGMSPSLAYDLDTQPAAPIAEADPARRIVFEPQESTMADEPSFSLGGALKTAAGPAALFNPLVGAGLGLAGALIDAFTPLAKEKITKEIGRHDVAPEIAGQMADSLIASAKKLTQRDDSIEAIAAARRDPAIMAKIEASALDKLIAAQPLLDRLREIDAASNAAEIASADAAAERGRKDSVDLGPLLAKAAIGITFYILTALFVLIGMSIQKDPTGQPDMSLVMVALQIILPIAGLIVVIVAYRFGRAALNQAGGAITATLTNK